MKKGRTNDILERSDNIQMRQLIKYFSTRQYAEMFRQGKLYMNSLSYFWENGIEDQRDILEGVSGTIDRKQFLSIQDRQLASGDPLFRLEAYQFCNLYCFYRVDISTELYKTPFTTSVFPDTRLIQLPNRNMEQFGKFVAIVKDENELIKRVLAAIPQEWLCVAGDVIYRKRPGMKKQPMNWIEVVSEKAYPASEILKIGRKTGNKDCFVKTDLYAGQKEWRICLFRNKNENDAYILNVGDLSDLVQIVPASAIQTTLLNQYKPCLMGEVDPQRNGYVGNVSRKEFRDKLYEFDGGLGKIVMFLGS